MAHVRDEWINAAMAALRPAIATGNGGAAAAPTTSGQGLTAGSAPPPCGSNRGRQTLPDPWSAAHNNDGADPSDPLSRGVPVLQGRDMVDQHEVTWTRMSNRMADQLATVASIATTNGRWSRDQSLARSPIWAIVGSRHWGLAEQGAAATAAAGHPL